MTDRAQPDSSRSATLLVAGLLLVGIAVLLGGALLVTRQLTQLPPAPVAGTAQPNDAGPGSATTGAGVTATGQATVTQPLPKQPAPGDTAHNLTQRPVEATDAVQWPDSVLVDGAAVPPGPDGVVSDGARAFARRLTARLLAGWGHRLEDAAELDALAEQFLGQQLAQGYPTVGVRQGMGGAVRIEPLAVLPATPEVRLSPPPPHAQSVGVAVGVARRAEPGYAPDLVLVAAVAYR